MSRAVLFTITGALWCANSLVVLTHPNYQDAASATDWFTVLSLSAALFALALTLPTLAQLIGRRGVYKMSLIPAAGAALAGLSNLLEDALHMSWAFWFTALGLAAVDLGLLALTIMFAVTGRGRLRLLAAVPAATLIDVLFLHEAGGGVVVLVACLGAAALAVSRPAPTAAPSVLAH